MKTKPNLSEILAQAMNELTSEGAPDNIEAEVALANVINTVKHLEGVVFSVDRESMLPTFYTYNPLSDDSEARDRAKNSARMMRWGKFVAYCLTSLPCKTWQSHVVRENCALEAKEALNAGRSEIQAARASTLTIDVVAECQAGGLWGRGRGLAESLGFGTTAYYVALERYFQSAILPRIIRRKYSDEQSEEDRAWVSRSSTSLFWSHIAPKVRGTLSDEAAAKSALEHFNVMSGLWPAGMKRLLRDEANAVAQVLAPILSSASQIMSGERTYELLSGSDITDALKQMRSGPLHSCMTNGSAPMTCSLFADNPERVRMLVQRGPNGDITARAYLWSTDSKRLYLDRIYPSNINSHEYQALQDYAIRKGWSVRGSSSHPYSDDYRVPEDIGNDTITLNWPSSEQWPYMDTFYLGHYLKDGRVKLFSGNANGIEDFRLSYTDGDMVRTHKRHKCAACGSYTTTNSNGSAPSSVRFMGHYGSPPQRMCQGCLENMGPTIYSTPNAAYVRADNPAIVTCAYSGDVMFKAQAHEVRSCDPGIDGQWVRNVYVCTDFAGRPIMNSEAIAVRLSNGNLVLALRCDLKPGTTELREELLAHPYFQLHESVEPF